MRYIYLHGFASGPASSKAKAFRSLFRNRPERLLVPDLNLPRFRSLTVTRQLETVRKLQGDGEEPVTLIGSSMGGYVAALHAEMDPRVRKLVLLAPAFGFLRRRLQSMDGREKEEWKKKGTILVDHYATGKKEPLEYGILEDAARYDRKPWKRHIKARIFHGIYDEVVPHSGSVRYLKKNPLALVSLLASDHTLLDVLPEILEESSHFLFGDE